MKFIADGMLGKLGRWLRFMGYDTLYFNVQKKSVLVRTARSENRLILTKDRRLCSENPEITVLLTAEGTARQLKEVADKLALKVSPEAVLVRCGLCNRLLEKREKEVIRELVPEYVYQTKTVFRQCPECKRVYWEGDHVRNIKAVLAGL